MLRTYINTYIHLDIYVHPIHHVTLHYISGSTAFTALVKAVSQSPDELGRCLSDVEHIRDKEFANFFWTAYDDVRRRKLGFKHFSEETDGEFWLELQNLMHKYYYLLTKFVFS